MLRPRDSVIISYEKNKSLGTKIHTKKIIERSWEVVVFFFKKKKRERERERKRERRK